MNRLLRTLALQRHDDHRLYHHSRINQSLHLVSALSFLASYALLFTHPVAAVLMGWLVAMTTRQAGHFFFEPKGYDFVNDATHEHKEAIKVGYNLQRKIVLLSIWALAPVALLADPTLSGLLPSPQGAPGYVHNVAMMWLALGAGALLFRAGQLCAAQDATTALAWLLKILTDPFHDIALYWKAPLHLLKGELIDPMGARPRV